MLAEERGQSLKSLFIHQIIKYLLRNALYSEMLEIKNVTLEGFIIYYEI